MTPKPLSIQMYTVRTLTPTPDDFRKVVRELAAIGYAGIEAGAPADMKPREFKKFVDDLGLKISSSWAQPNKDNLSELVDVAKEYGIDGYVGCWGPDNFKTDDEVKKTADAFEGMAQLLKPHGLSMYYHNHWWEFEYPTPDPKDFGWDKFFRLAPTVRCELDLYWASNFGKVDVPSVVRKYAKKTPLLHVKDGPLVKDAANTAVGKGKMDTKACVEAADPSVLKWLIVELDSHDGDMMQAVRDSYAYLTANDIAKGTK